MCACTRAATTYAHVDTLSEHLMMLPGFKPAYSVHDKYQGHKLDPWPGSMNGTPGCSLRLTD